MALTAQALSVYAGTSQSYALALLQPDGSTPLWWVRSV